MSAQRNLRFCGIENVKYKFAPRPQARHRWARDPPRLRFPLFKFGVLVATGRVGYIVSRTMDIPLSPESSCLSPSAVVATSSKSAAVMLLPPLEPLTL